jgi:hypothetical protein
MPPPQFLLNATLADLSDAWLRLDCCQGITYVPIRLLAGASRVGRLRDVLPRMRCKVCRGRPKRAALVESPAGEAAGGPPPGWVIRLD